MGRGILLFNDQHCSASCVHNGGKKYKVISTDLYSQFPRRPQPLISSPLSEGVVSPLGVTGEEAVNQKKWGVIDLLFQIRAPCSLSHLFFPLVEGL